MAKRTFLTHNWFSTITLSDGTKFQFLKDKLELDDTIPAEAEAIKELDKVANRSAIYTPESGMTIAPTEIEQARIAGEQAVAAAAAQHAEAAALAKLTQTPAPANTLTASSATEAAAKLLAASKAEATAQ